MKTYFEIANDFAIEMFPKHDSIVDWNSFLNYYGDRHPEWFNQYHREIARRYATECVKASLARASHNCNTDFMSRRLHSTLDIQQSITSPNNIILL